jgi:hypothetical protein
MAVDLQIVFPQEAVILNKVRVLPGPPRVVEVVGADFRAVDEVIINRVVSPDVFVASKTRLYAQVPDSQLDQRILSVSVLSRRLTVSPRSILRFRLGKRPGKVVGILRLLQKFVKVLFTTPGTDVFNQQLGGGALKIIGELQSRNPSLPLDERLLSAKILTAGFNKEEGAIDISVEIVSQAGRAALANLEL